MDGIPKPLYDGEQFLCSHLRAKSLNVTGSNFCLVRVSESGERAAQDYSAERAHPRCWTDIPLEDASRPKQLDAPVGGGYVLRNPCPASFAKDEVARMVQSELHRARPPMLPDDIRSSDAKSSGRHQLPAAWSLPPGAENKEIHPPAEHPPATHGPAVHAPAKHPPAAENAGAAAPTKASPMTSFARRPSSGSDSPANWLAPADALTREYPHLAARSRRSARLVQHGWAATDSSASRRYERQHRKMASSSKRR